MNRLIPHITKCHLPTRLLVEVPRVYFEGSNAFLSGNGSAEWFLSQHSIVIPTARADSSKSGSFSYPTKGGCLVCLESGSNWKHFFIDCGLDGFERSKTGPLPGGLFYSGNQFIFLVVDHALGDGSVEWPESRQQIFSISTKREQLRDLESVSSDPVTLPFGNIEKVWPVSQDLFLFRAREDLALISLCSGEAKILWHQKVSKKTSVMFRPGGEDVVVRNPAEVLVLDAQTGREVERFAVPHELRNKGVGDMIKLSSGRWLYSAVSYPVEHYPELEFYIGQTLSADPLQSLGRVNVSLLLDAEIILRSDYPDAYNIRLEYLDGFGSPGARKWIFSLASECDENPGAWGIVELNENSPEKFSFNVGNLDLGCSQFEVIDGVLLVREGSERVVAVDTW